MDIIHGEILELIKDFPDNSFDFICTEPQKDYYFFDDVENIIPDLYRILKDNRVMCVFTSQYQLFNAGITIKESGFDIINIIKWVTKGKESVERLIKNNTYIIVARKGTTNFFNYPFSLVEEDVGSVVGQPLNEIWYGDKRGKKIEKPEWLINRLIMLYTKDRERVLDCFAGTGMVGVSCIKLERDFLLVENDYDNYKTAIEYINATKQGFKNRNDLEGLME